MIPLELHKIRTHLRSLGIESELQTETNQLCILFKIAERDFPLFIRVYEGGELLQLLGFIPCNTKKETVADTARLLHLLNKEIDLPGFGMDENSEVVFYRCMIPAKDKKIDGNILNSYINATQVVCQSFAAVIAGVAYGAATFDEVVAKSKENKSQSLSQSNLKKA